MNEECFLGFDGGQSASRCLIVDAEGHVLLKAVGPPFEHIDAPGGKEKIRRAFGECLAGVTGATGVTGGRPYAVKSAFLGLTGLWSPESPEAGPILEIFRSVLHVGRLSLDSDSVSCWAGAFACRPGIVLAAGTGVVAYGVSPGGRSVKVGGWGYVMGDLGSAFDIGHKALILIAAESDRGGPRSLLTSRILDHLGAADPRELQRRLYRLEEQRQAISSLASVVAECAREGDQGAAQILRESGCHLAELAITAIQRLDWLDRDERDDRDDRDDRGDRDDGDEGNGGGAALAREPRERGPAVGSGPGPGPVPESMSPPVSMSPVVPVACAGGVFKAGSLLRDAFRAAVLSRFNNVCFVEPSFEPVVGAVLLAWRQAGVEITLERLKALTEGISGWSDLDLRTDWSDPTTEKRAGDQVDGANATA